MSVGKVGSSQPERGHIHKAYQNTTSQVHVSKAFGRTATIRLFLATPSTLGPVAILPALLVFLVLLALLAKRLFAMRLVVLPQSLDIVVAAV